ncbi:MAG: ABC transporter permease [Oscillospiraceae bacterium]|jgi:oligopeptide transport system permease protein|nr:ABC transporter permease [Oscillospiraceae bacterium]
MKRWALYISRRLLYMAVTLWLIITATFLLMSLLPGSPYNYRDQLSQAQIDILDQKYGLNQPLAVRYVTYLRNILHGDFGISLQFSDQPITKLLANRVGPSMRLGLQAVAFGTVVGTILGVIAAMRQNTWIDTFSSLFAIIGRSTPNFVVAVILQFTFAVSLKLLPIGLWKDGFRSTILPTLALSISPMADAARFIRTEMVEVLGSDYIELARAKGMSETRLAFTHGLRNALIPLVTIIGPMTVSLMTGSLVVENIFAIPGIGEQFTKSILSNDYYTIMAVTILYSSLLLAVIFVMDVLYQVIDPRVRVEADA